MKKRFVLGTIVICMIIFSFNNKITVSSSSSESEKINDQYILAVLTNSPRLVDLSLTPHEPILITHDDNFTDYGFGGSGIQGDPYVIEDFEIITTAEKAIAVENTTKHFVIRNCYVEARDGQVWPEGYGIYFSNVTEGTASAEENTCVHNDFGIFVFNSANTMIINNTCRNGYYGIRIEQSSGVNVINNTHSPNMAGISIYSSPEVIVANNSYNLVGGTGILLRDSPDAIVTNNYCNYSSTSISLFQSSGVTVINNYCSYQQCGIRISECTGGTIANNSCSNNYFYGISLRDSIGVTIDSNTCSNNDEAGIDLEYSQNTILINNTCSDNQIGFQIVYSQGSILRNNRFFETGLSLWEFNITAYSTYTVEDNEVNDKILGFYCNLNQITLLEPIYGQLILINCNETVISNQDLSNALRGIFLGWCEDFTISNNICNSNNYTGIYIQDSTEGIVTNNNCSNSGSGMFLENISEVTISNNTCNNNRGSGIYVHGLSNIILSENILNNNAQGIRVVGTDFCLIRYNILQENKDYGIHIYYSSCIVHHNSFINNNLEGTGYGTSQAYDSGWGNIWYDEATKEGNHWSGWNKKKPYPIDGNADSTDPYPLNEEFKRASYELISFISAFVVVITLYKRYKNKKSAYLHRMK